MLKLLFAKQLEEYEYNNSIIVKKYMKTDDDNCVDQHSIHLPINDNDWGFFVDLEKNPTTNNQFEKYSNSHTITVAPYEINMNPTMTRLYNNYNNNYNYNYNNNNYNKKQDDYSLKHHASLFTCLSVATIFIMYYF